MGFLSYHFSLYVTMVILCTGTLIWTSTTDLATTVVYNYKLLRNDVMLVHPLKKYYITVLE